MIFNELTFVFFFFKNHYQFYICLESINFYFMIYWSLIFKNYSHSNYFVKYFVIKFYLLKHLYNVYYRIIILVSLI